MNNTKNKYTDKFKQFKKGLVYGFDLGTHSLGYAVRKGDVWLEEGVIAFHGTPETLDQRRSHRTARRRNQRRKQRLNWLKDQLVKMNFIDKNHEPGSKASPVKEHPATLRYRALQGEKLSGEELHTALHHLFKKRGFKFDVPWANQQLSSGDDEKEVREQWKETREQLDEYDSDYIGEYLHKLWEKTLECQKEGKPEPRMIDHNFPRDLIEEEYRQIVKQQKQYYPVFEETTPEASEERTWEDWIIYGDCELVKEHDGPEVAVYDRLSEQNRGMLALRYAHFNNRNVGRDQYQPFDENGRPLHRVSRDRDEYREFQFGEAITNFRVRNEDGKTVDPPAEIIKAIREHYETKKDNQKPQITVNRLQKIIDKYNEEYGSDYSLIDGQTRLTPGPMSGRSRFSTPTLKKFDQEYAKKGKRPPVNQQPLLRYPEESIEDACERWLRDMAFPLGEHRLRIYLNLMRRLKKEHSAPDYVVMETTRDLAVGKKTASKIIRQREEKEKKRDKAFNFWQEAGFEHPSRNQIALFRLWEQTEGQCIYCGETISQDELINDKAELEHIVPRSTIVCDELFNRVVAHSSCNADKAGNNPYEAFFNSENEKYNWDEIVQRTGNFFREGSLKYKLIVLPPDETENILRDKFQAPLTKTGYIVQMARTLTIIEMDWLNEEGRDPSSEGADHDGRRYMTTTGGTTYMLRKHWGLKYVLHDHHEDLEKEADIENLESEANEDRRHLKARFDLRNHALDAMVIACTYPPMARMRSSKQHKKKSPDGYWAREDGKLTAMSDLFYIGYDAVREMIPDIEVTHYVPNQLNASHAEQTFLGKRTFEDEETEKEKTWFIKRKSLRDLVSTSSGKLKKNINTSYTPIYPPELGSYLEIALEKYREEDNPTPEGFVNQLCFSTFQSWRDKGADPDQFSFPCEVKIPIKKVRVRAYKGGKRPVIKVQPHAYVARDGYKGIAIYETPEGEREAIMVPYWENDPKYQEEKAKIPSGSRQVYFLPTHGTLKLEQEYLQEKGWVEFGDKYRLQSYDNQGHGFLVPIFLTDDSSSQVESSEIKHILGGKETKLNSTLNQIKEHIVIE